MSLKKPSCNLSLLNGGLMLSPLKRGMLLTSAEYGCIGLLMMELFLSREPSLIAFIGGTRRLFDAPSVRRISRKIERKIERIITMRQIITRIIFMISKTGLANSILWLDKYFFNSLSLILVSLSLVFLKDTLCLFEFWNLSE